MTPTSREAQRAELHKAIWRVANDLRGSVDGWDFKSYVLGMLFYRFISENLTVYLNRQERAAGNADFDYSKLSDAEAEFGRADTVNEKGFFILPSELFANVRANASNDENLNEALGRIFQNIEGSAVGAASEDDIKGLFQELDPNSNKLGNTVAQRNQKLVKLLNVIGDLNLGDFENHEIDAFGDAYEYLMQMYAADAGKSGGEYYTPQEVSELLAQIASIGKTELKKVYDPAVGSGSLLLKFQKVLGPGKVGGYFGQEINLNTYNLARINMFLHDVPYEQFHLAHGDTLEHPAHWDDEPFEAIVSNPPYSIKWAGDANPLLINDPRFAPAGVLAPKSKADLAFTMHILSWLAVNGTAAIVEFPGVMYRGGAEAKIRKYLVDNNYVDAVIQLPPDLFFGTTIATCILVLKKSKSTNDVVFIDASAEFTRGGSKNKLTDAHRERILTTLVERAPVDHYAELVSNTDVAAHGYLLSVSSYVEAEDTREVMDISAINTEIASIVSRQVALRISVDEIVADLEERG
jgi:type I restriction enzyme M protein